MLFLRQLHILPLLCHKSATTCQIDSYKALNTKLNSDQNNCVNNEMIEFTAPPQYPQKRGRIFWDTLYILEIHTHLLLCVPASISGFE